MLYDQPQPLTPNLKMHKEAYLLLDLSILQKPIFRNICKQIAESVKIQQNIIASRFADTLISPDDLNLRIKAVILPYNCFQRQFKPIDQANEYPIDCTPFQFLRKKYQNYLTIGIKIDLNKTDQFQQLWEKKNVKKIKLFSFDLIESQLDKQLPLMRKYVKLLFVPSKKIHFHIKLQMQSVEALRKLKQQLILHQYPIEYCMYETNLINLIQRHLNVSISNNWELMAFKYINVIGKYIPAAIGCLLQAYSCNQLNTNPQISSILQCLNYLNHRNNLQLKEYKRHHNTGMGSIEPLILQLLKDYTPEQYGHFRLKGDWGLYLGQLNDVLSGKYKKQHQNQFQYKIEQN